MPWRLASTTDSPDMVFVPDPQADNLPVRVTISPLQNNRMVVSIKTANLESTGNLSLLHTQFIQSIYRRSTARMLSRDIDPTDPTISRFNIGTVSVAELVRISEIYGIDAPEFTQLVNPGVVQTDGRRIRNDDDFDPPGDFMRETANNVPVNLNAGQTPNPLFRQNATILGDLNDLHVPVGNQYINNEDAMEQLTEWQENTVKKLNERYKDKKQELGGAKEVIKNLKNFLIDQFISRPLKDKIKYNGVELPLTWDALQAKIAEKNWSEEQFEAALKVYFADPVHTMFRYFLQPNPWMAPPDQAHFVIRDNQDRGTAEFARYEELIATMWLAASDPAETGNDRLSVIDRQKNFIAIAAELNRVHNYDSGGTLHQDDGERDKPSCHMGVRSRLFSSVPDHSLMQLDPAEYAEFEIAKFFQNLYVNLLTTLTRAQFIKFYELIHAGQDIVSPSTEAEIRLLQNINITAFQKNLLKTAVTNQMGRVDPSYRGSVLTAMDAAFAAYETKYQPRAENAVQAPNTTNTAQHFYDYFIPYNFEQILKQVAQTKGVTFDTEGTIIPPRSSSPGPDRYQ